MQCVISFYARELFSFNVNLIKTIDPHNACINTNIQTNRYKSVRAHIKTHADTHAVYVY